MFSEKYNVQIPILEEKAHIFLFETVPSVFDIAYEMANRGEAGIWDSVLANSQSAGRGQLRRKWYSPPGNIYVCLRLPQSELFSTTGATPFLGLLCGLALQNLGWPVRLKWPNDLVLISDGLAGKVGGILLEERGNFLLAGIGINLISHPLDNNMRINAALPSASLNMVDVGRNAIQPVDLWTEILTQMVEQYMYFSCYDHQWHDRFNEFLLWKDMQVEIEEGSNKYFGKLLGINEKGGLQILCGNGVTEFFGGNLGLAQEYNSCGSEQCSAIVS